MKDWWKWLLTGAVVGSLLTGLFLERRFTKQEAAWISAREAAARQHASDSIAMAAVLIMQAAAERERDVALAEAARLTRQGDSLAGRVRDARAQLAAAATVRDSLDLAVVVIGRQDTLIGNRDSTITSLQAAIAAAAQRAHADSLALGLVTGDRDRLQHLVDTAPVGRPQPRLLGLLPMPRFVVGGGVVGDRSHVGLGLFAGLAVAL